MRISEKIRLGLSTISPKWLALTVTCSCLSLVFLNASAMPVAIPSIGNQLSIPESKIEWVINAYFLTLAIFILPAGRLTDIFGIRRLMSLGFFLFSLGSLWCSFSGNFEYFLLGRAIQGLGGALMFPAMGAHLVSSFPPGERGRGMGLNTGISSFFWIFGPIIGGGVTQYLNWRYLMLINIPIALFGMMMTHFTIPKRARKKQFSFDSIGALFLGLSMGTITVGLMQGSKWGWKTPLVISLFFLGLISIATFIISSFFKKNPIIDLSFFKNRSFTSGTLCACFTQMISMVMVFWALYMQTNLSYSPTIVGTLILISHIPIVFSSPLGGYLGDKWGVRLPVIIGFLLSGSGLIWLSLIAHLKNILFFLPPLILFGIGQPLILAPCYSVSMESIDQEKCAAASGVALGLRQLSLPFGMAILSAFYSFVLEKEHTVLFAFRSLNFMAVTVALLGIATAFIFFPKTKSADSQA